MGVDRIFSIVPDRCQILLYEKHGLCFVTAVFEICPAYIYCGGKINFIDVFGIFRCFTSLIFLKFLGIKTVAFYDRKPRK